MNKQYAIQPHKTVVDVQMGFEEHGTDTHFAGMKACPTHWRFPSAVVTHPQST